MIVRRLHSRDTGAVDDIVKSMIGIVLPTFLVLNMLLSRIKKLKTFIKTLITTRPKCFKFICVTPSDTALEVDLIYFKAGWS